MGVIRDFWAKVSYTDVEGLHPAGSLARIPYESDAEIAAAQSMVNYGILTDQAPAETLRPNEEQPVVAPAQEQSSVQAPNDENEVQADVKPVPVVTEGQDDPKTPYFDARDSSGHFVAEEAPKEEAPKEESTPTEKKPVRKK